MATKIKPFVPRVNQLDAIQLDKDITKLIRDALVENLPIPPILFSKIKPELDLLIQSAIWFGSVGKQFSTFGQQILQLSYESNKLTKSRLCLHFLLTILPNYLKNINETRLLNFVGLEKFLIYGNNIALVLSVFNFMRFLKTGRKPSLIDFLLNLDYVTLETTHQRNLGYEYMTRELVWGGFTELFGLVLPLINFQKTFRVIFNIFSKKKLSINPNIKPILTMNTLCTFCGDRPALPHHFGCGHIFCFYCIEANVLTVTDYQCPKCDAKVISILPVPFTSKS